MPLVRQTEVVFDGGSLVMDKDQNLILELPYFREDLQSVTLDVSTMIFREPILKKATELTVMKDIPAAFNEHHNIPFIHQAIILSIQDYFGKMGFKEAIVASSGGIDSAVVLALASEALGAGNVRAVLMPSQFSSGHSVSDAEQLAQNLGNHYDIIPIKDVFDSMMVALQPAFKDLPFSVAEENLQSRVRGNLVMGLANKFGYILLNTSNKSELSTGYGTLYGDMAGGLGVLGDLYKTAGI